MNKKITFSLLFIFIDLVSHTQTAPLTYLVSFKNKAGTPHSLATPATFLSQRAIARRNNHGISLDSTDLPVNPGYIDSLNNISGVAVICRSKWFNNATIMVADTGVLS
ncbi:MAG TPA: hypothetical protein VD905_14550, partial [Flavobacteriales bacterium]|nr:hypothetical protein [Flavobacteriales bacterium]